MVRRPVYVDSALGQVDQSLPGQVKLKLANPLRGVSRVRLRDAQIPRLDDITYIAVGLRCGKQSFIDNGQVPYNPSAVTTTGSFSMTGISPGPPIFAILPVAQASSIDTLSFSASVPYVYLNQERYDFEFRPPIQFLEDIEVYLYRPPDPNTPSLFLPYDTRAYILTLSAAAPTDLIGARVTNKAIADQRQQPYWFTATVVATGSDHSKLLLASVSSAAAMSAWGFYLQQPGLLDAERAVYRTSGEQVSTAAELAPLVTQVTLNLEFDCGA